MHLLLNVLGSSLLSLPVVIVATFAAYVGVRAVLDFIKPAGFLGTDATPQQVETFRASLVIFFIVSLVITWALWHFMLVPIWRPLFIL